MSSNAPATADRRAVLRLAAAAVPWLAVPAAARPARAQAGGGTPIRVGVIGSGNIGGTLGALWVRAGHPVLFSSRNPERLKEMVDGLGPLARAGTPAEAAAFGDAVLVAVPYAALPELGRDLSRELAGKVVLDACNAVPARDGAIAETARERGIGPLSAELLPGARVVRAFNSLNHRVLAREAHRAGPPLAVPIAGDDAEAVRVASGLVRDAGFEPVVVGPLARASDFAMGARGFGQGVTAPELRQRLGLGR